MGTFYPEDVKGAERLGFYAKRFETVEVNATFYRTPTGTMIDAWNRRLPPDFHLVVKAPRFITHRKKLVDCAEPLQLFLDRVLQLRTLRVILWQLPPSLHQDIERLDRFLAELPPRTKVRHALEFRHASWWDEKVVDLLAEHAASFVAISHPTLPDVIHATTDFLYLRFHGLGKELYRYDYSGEELDPWVSRVKPYLRGRTLYAFFNNDYEANAPRNATVFRDLLGGR